MDYAFSLSGGRRVGEANYNTFVNPLPHPDRVMQQHDFLYILDGTWEAVIENEGRAETFELGKGDLVILPAGIHHYGTRLCSPNSRNMYLHVEAAEGDCPAEQEEAISVNCPVEREEAVSVNCPDGQEKAVSGDSPAELTDGKDGKRDSVLLPTLLHCGGSMEISRYFSEIIAVYWGDSLYKSNRLSSLFDLLLCELGEQVRKAPVSPQSLAFVHTIAQFLQTNPERFFSVSDIVREFNVSEKTLNKRFKTAYGKTFYVWQMEQKLEMVYQYLHNHPDITLKETAINFGFYDEFHLSRAFKKKFGAAPKYVR